MNRSNIIVVIILLACTHTVFAQGKKEKKKHKGKTEEKVPVFNYVIDDPMDVFGRTPDTTTPTRNPITPKATPTLNLPEPAPTLYRILVLPDFYSYKPTINGDTTFKYLAYDRRDSLIDVDTLHDIEAVRYISLFINYPDHQHNYRNAQGQILPLPVSKIIKRWDKLGTSKWMSIDYANNKYTELREDKTIITRKESVTINHPDNNTSEETSLRYYSVK